MMQLLKAHSSGSFDQSGVERFALHFWFTQSTDRTMVGGCFDAPPLIGHSQVLPVRVSTVQESPPGAFINTELESAQNEPETELAGAGPLIGLANAVRTCQSDIKRNGVELQ